MTCSYTQHIKFIFIIHYLQTYITECVGVDFVGYTMMVYGLGNSLGSFISGKILSLGCKALLVLVTLVLHLAIMIFLIFWEREPVLFVLLIVVFLWGICDGSWLTVCNSKYFNYMVQYVCNLCTDYYNHTCVCNAKNLMCVATYQEFVIE